MSFGDWELFRMVVISLREQELSSFSIQEEGPRSVRFTVGNDQIVRKGNFCFLLYYKIIIKLVKNLRVIHFYFLAML